VNGAVIAALLLWRQFGWALADPIFAAFGIPEVWRFDGEKLEILLLTDGKYIKREYSACLPLVPSEVVTNFLNESRSLGRLEWLKRVREWARQQKESR